MIGKIISGTVEVVSEIIGGIFEGIVELLGDLDGGMVETLNIKLMGSYEEIEALNAKKNRV